MLIVHPCEFCKVNPWARLGALALAWHLWTPEVVLKCCWVFSFVENRKTVLVRIVLKILPCGVEYLFIHVHEEPLTIDDQYALE